jgi:hypothetical protein
MSDIVGPAIDVRGPFTETWVNPARWKHRLIEAMCDRFHRENGDEPEPARGDIEDRSGVAEEVQPAEDVGQTESES